MRNVAFSLTVSALSMALSSLPARGNADHNERAVQVAPFATTPSLSMFGAEVARAVAGELSQTGIEVATTGAPVVGRIDELSSDRVRLSATIFGRSAQVEGLLEQVDLLATELATKLVPLVPSGAHRVGAAGHPNPRVPAPKKGPAIVTSAPASDAGVAQAATTKPIDVVTPTPAIPLEALAPPPPTTPDPKPTEAPPETPAPTRPSVALDLPARAQSRRVILHEVALPEGCPRYNTATYAARVALERRGLQVLAGGCGVIESSSVAAESARAGGAAVVMAQIEWIGYVPVRGGYRAEGRFHLVVAQGGRTALYEVVNLSARPMRNPSSASSAYELATIAFARYGSAIERAIAPYAPAPVLTNDTNEKNHQEGTR